MFLDFSKTFFNMALSITLVLLQPNPTCFTFLQFIDQYFQLQTLCRPKSTNSCFNGAFFSMVYAFLAVLAGPGRTAPKIAYNNDPAFFLFWEIALRFKIPLPKIQDLNPECHESNIPIMQL